MSPENNGREKLRILFIDESNDIQSQLAEYFLTEKYGGSYEAYSAGPKSDCVDCEMIAVMYQEGMDIRRSFSKSFAFDGFPEEFDYLVFLEKATYDAVKDDVPWDAPQILADFGRKEGFSRATDDATLFECYVELIDKVRDWVFETFSDPDNLKKLVP